MKKALITLLIIISISCRKNSNKIVVLSEKISYNKFKYFPLWDEENEVELEALSKDAIVLLTEL